MKRAPSCNVIVVIQPDGAETNLLPENDRARTFPHIQTSPYFFKLISAGPPRTARGLETCIVRRQSRV